MTETFIEFADTLANDYDTGDFLHTLVDRCCEILQVTTGGVLLEDSSGSLVLAAASSEHMRIVEDAELAHSEGPCIDAYQQAQRIVAVDLRHAGDRWPHVAPCAVRHGLLAVCALPLRLRGDSIGALNLYRDESGEFDDDDMRLAQAFADVAAIGILQDRKVTDAERRADQLQHALNSRVIIEQAKGVLVGRLSITPGEAFERIRHSARSRSIKVGEICHDVIHADFTPPEVPQRSMN